MAKDKLIPSINCNLDNVVTMLKLCDIQAEKASIHLIIELIQLDIKKKDIRISDVVNIQNKITKFYKNGKKSKIRKAKSC